MNGSINTAPMVSAGATYVEYSGVVPASATTITFTDVNKIGNKNTVSVSEILAVKGIGVGIQVDNNDTGTITVSLQARLGPSMDFKEVATFTAAASSTTQKYYGLSDLAGIAYELRIKWSDTVGNKAAADIAVVIK